jgi:rhodanese-related sulfurtransferase
MLRPLFAALLLTAAVPAAAQPALLNPQIDYDGYVALIEEVRPYRLARLLDWDRFIAAAAEPDVLILDARSERQFAQGHIAGAVNLPLPEFSVERLAEVIGRPDRPILIYCNNNFRNDRPPAILKSGRLALNLSTFTHLYGYGYRNVRELNDVMDMDDPNVRWVSG